MNSYNIDLFELAEILNIITLANVLLIFIN